MGGSVPSLLFVLRPNYGRGDGGNASTGVFSAPDPMVSTVSHTSARDSWTLTGKSGSISCGDHCSILLGLGMHKVLFVPSNSRFP